MSVDRMEPLSNWQGKGGLVYSVISFNRGQERFFIHIHNKSHIKERHLVATGEPCCYLVATSCGRLGAKLLPGSHRCMGYCSHITSTLTDIPELE